MNNADTDYDQIETNLLCVSSDYRIIRNDVGRYVPERYFLFFWWSLVSDEHSYPTIEEARAHVDRVRNKPKREVIEYL